MTNTEIQARPDFGISFEGKESPGLARTLAQTAEQAGAPHLWVASHLFHREPIAQAALALAATDTLRITLMAMSPYSVHPVYATMAAATLDEYFPGRVSLCFGVGAPRDLQSAGLEPTQPLQTIREAIGIARALLGGDTIQHDGKVFQVHGRRLELGARPLPIVLAASGPHMLELAGQIADGVLISAATSVEFIQWCLGLVAKGEASSGRRIRRVGIVYASVAASEKEAHRPLRRTLGFILRGAHHARNLELGGSQLNQEALARAFAQEQWNEVETLVTDDIVARHAASGTPDQVRQRFALYNAIGLDEIVFAGQDNPDRLRTLLESVRTD